jgi:DNA-binding MarR family transcriptional regulator
MEKANFNELQLGKILTIEELSRIWKLNDISKLDKLLLLAIAIHSDKKWVCRLKNEELEELTGFTQSQLSRHFQTLEAYGYISRNRVGQTGREIRIHIEKIR